MSGYSYKAWSWLTKLEIKLTGCAIYNAKKSEQVPCWQYTTTDQFYLGELLNIWNLEIKKSEEEPEG